MNVNFGILEKMMLEIIKNVILKWDSMSLMEFVPPDEYDPECSDTFHAYAEKLKHLSEIIYDIFKGAFGDEFKDDISKCTAIAEEIEALQKNHSTSYSVE